MDKQKLLDSGFEVTIKKKNGVDVFIKNGKEYSELEFKTHFQSDIDSKISEYKLDKIKRDTMMICDSKQQQAIESLLTYRSTPSQLKRYEDKYQRALNDEFTEKENEEIITNHESYLQQIRVYIDVIESFRKQISDIIDDGEIEKAQKILNSYKSLSVTATQSDINELFD